MSHIITNGKKLFSEIPCISAFDRGLTLGHGLFETILFKNGSCPLLEYHWKRLVTSCRYLDIKIPFDFKTLNQMIYELISTNKLMEEKAAVRLTLTDGVSERGILPKDKPEPTYILTASPIQAQLSPSTSAMIVTTRRNEHSFASKIKSISYLDNILAKKEAVSNGFDEAFLLNSRSYLAEGAISNVFIVKNNVIYTPPIKDGALPGVIRSIILTELPLKEIEVKEQSIDIDFLSNADEIFISNALLGVRSIHKLGDKDYVKPFLAAQSVAEALKSFFDYP